jgi:hypothetical protein
MGEKDDRILPKFRTHLKEILLSSVLPIDMGDTTAALWPSTNLEMIQRIESSV